MIGFRQNHRPGVALRYFEDCQVGDVFRSSTPFRVEAEAIRRYAETWDPMPYHLSEARAANTPVGELFAPAVMTLSIAVRLTHDSGFYDVSTAVGLGIDEVRMPKPVLVGDDLSVTVLITDLRDSTTRPALGLIMTRTDLLNQHDDLVMSYNVNGMVNRRPVSGS